MPAEIAFTHHAVKRYIQRHARELTYDAALARLQTAPVTKLRERTLLGQIQYEIQDPYCVLVVKRDRRSSPELVCVTVLPTRENSFGWTAEEEAIRNEWLADQAAAKVRRDVAAGPALILAPARGVEPKQGRVCNPPAPPTMPREPEVREFMLKAMALSVEKEREKTRRHELSEQLNGVVAKRCIRILLIDLVRRSAEGDESARAIAELVQEVRPEFLQHDFLRIETEKEGTES